MSFIFPVLACSFSVDEKPKTFKQDGRGAVKSAYQSSRKKKLLSNGKDVWTVDETFHVLIKVDGQYMFRQLTLNF